MSIHNLERIFGPDSVAVVGASQREGSVELKFDGLWAQN